MVIIALQELVYSRQQNLKQLQVCKPHLDWNEQFEFIAIALRRESIGLLELQ